MPGIGCPLVISSTICANDVGYGAAGALASASDGKTPPASLFAEPLLEESSTSSITEWRRTLFDVGGVGGGRLRASR
jgi:hypothetical protein